MAVFTEPVLLDLEAQMHDDPIAGFVAMWRLLEPRWDDLTEVRPSEYVIPVGQSVRLIEALRQGAEANNLGEFTYATGLWLNQGPATEWSD